MTVRKKAVVYARVSTDLEEQKTSIESQKEYYPQYAHDKGMEFVGLYYDEGLTGTNSNRKGFIQMLHDAGLDAKRGDGSLITFTTNDEREPLFDWIIIKDASRFARNINTIDIVRSLRDKQVYIEFENLGFTTADVDFEFRLGLFLTFSQEESLSTSRKMKHSYKSRAKKGEFHMSVNLLGYAKNNETKEYYIVKDEAETIRMIFDYYTKDLIGSSEIADRLNKQGRRTSKGKQWTISSVIRVLNNEKYKGQVILNRYGTTDITGTNKRITKPKSEWIIHDDAIPKIISIEQFDKAQEIMSTRTRSTAKTEGADKRQIRGRKIIRNIFYKKIYCGKCGIDYVRETSSRKNADGERIITYFYNCRNRRNRQKLANVKCDNRGVAHSLLERELDKIGEKIGSIGYGARRIREEEEALTHLLNQLDDKLQHSQIKKAEINDTIKELDDKISNITSTIAQGASETVANVLFTQIEQIEDERKQLQASLLQFEEISIQQEKQRYIKKFDEIVEFSKIEKFEFEELLRIVNRIDILENREAIVDIETPTLLDEIHKSDKGDALIPFTFQLNR